MLRGIFKTYEDSYIRVLCFAVGPVRSVTPFMYTCSSYMQIQCVYVSEQSVEFIANLYTATVYL